MSGRPDHSKSEQAELSALRRSAELLSALFEKWNAQSVPYLILRNYADLPATTSHDIDVLVPAGVRAHAEQGLRQVADRVGWRIHNVGEFACRAIYLHDPETGQQLHLDLFCDFSWRTLTYLDARKFVDHRIRERDFYIPSQAHEAAANLMSRLLYIGQVRDLYRPGIHAAARDQPQQFTASLAPWLGTAWAERLTAWASAQEWSTIEHRVAGIRRTVLMRNLCRPASMFRRIMRDSFRLLRRLRRPPGLVMVFLGADGSGKSSVASGVIAGLCTTFYPQHGFHAHWKPRPPLSPPVPPTIDPHARPPRPVPVSFVYWAYHLLGMKWAWWRYVMPARFRGGLVVIDRYYYDFLVDQRRYRLNLPPWLIRLGMKWVGQPQLVFILDAPPDVLRARKREVAHDECVRQRDAYRRLAKSLPMGHLIDATQPLETVINKVQRDVLNHLTQRAARWNPPMPLP